MAVETIDKILPPGWGTLMLRDIKQIDMPHSISWMPQTIGWKILGVVILIFAIYKLTNMTLNHLHNRYRKQLSEQLNQVDNTIIADKARRALQLAVHFAYPKNAHEINALSDQEWFASVSAMSPDSTPMEDELCTRWLANRFKPKAQQEWSENDAEQLRNWVNDWLWQHSNIYTKRAKS